VKGISASTFTKEDVETLEEGGNQVRKFNKTKSCVMRYIFHQIFQKGTDQIQLYQKI
jgi:hypothetical protein